MRFLKRKPSPEETMLRTLMTLCCVFSMSVQAQTSSSVIDGVFRIHRNKRLTSVMSTAPTSSRMECAVKCLNTIGCQAVSITSDNDLMSCGLVTGVTDVLDDVGSDIYVLDYCAKDPAFCFNGGTCEVTMTGARCHCTDRYQGDRCDTCADGYYGDSCDVTFIRHGTKRCSVTGYGLRVGDLEQCKSRCANDNNCGACEINAWSDVYLKGSPCALQTSLTGTTYVKTVV